MNLLSYFLSLLLAAYTVLVEPFVRTSTYRNLKKQLKVNPSARLPFYRRQILWEWVWVVLIALVFLPKPDQLPIIGVALPNTMGWILIAAMLIIAALSTIFIKRNPNALANAQRSLAGSSVLLPTTPTERSWYIAAALTAGICEELLYRGFFIYFLRTNLPMLNEVLVLSLVSGVVYGLSRAYQGTRGILQTGIMGFAFAIVLFLSTSLLTAMLFHFLIDILNLFFWPPQPDDKKLQ